MSIRGFSSQPAIAIPKVLLSFKYPEWRKQIPLISEPKEVEPVPAIGIYIFRSPIGVDQNKEPIPRIYAATGFLQSIFLIQPKSVENGVSNSNNNTIIFLDITVNAEPGTYEMGFVVQVGVYETKNVRYVFRPTGKPFTVNSVTGTIFWGSQLYVGLPVMLIGILLMGFLTCRCKFEKHVIEKVTVLHSEKSEQEKTPHEKSFHQLPNGTGFSQSGNQMMFQQAPNMNQNVVQQEFMQFTPQMNQMTNYPQIMQQPIQPVNQHIPYVPKEQVYIQPYHPTQNTYNPNQSTVQVVTQKVEFAKPPSRLEAMKNRFKNFFIGIWKLIATRGSKLMQDHGTDAYFFEKYMTYEIIFTAIFMIIANVILLPIDYAFAEKTRFADFAANTVGALAQRSGARAAHTVVHYLYVIGGFVLVFMIVRIVTHKRRLFFSEYTVRALKGN